MSPQNGIKRKSGTWIKLYAEKWIHGSTRGELTNAELAVLVDLLALAALNDPPGQVDFTSFRRLANQLNISQKLLKGCIKKALLNNKIRLGRFHIDPQSGKRIEETSPNYDEYETSVINSVADQSNYGTTQFSLIILNWSRYQSEYLRQRPYRNEKPTPETQEDKDLKVITRVTDRGEEKKVEEIRLEEKKGEDSEVTPPEPVIDAPSPPFLSNPSNDHLKEHFLLLLKNCFGYPFDQENDSRLFDCAAEELPGIDLLEQTAKKIDWWKSHPRAIGRSPRRQLREWFIREFEFQSKHSYSRCKENRVDPHVGSQPPGPSDEEKALISQWEKEYKAKLAQYMEKNGIKNEADVDITKPEVPSWTEYLNNKLNRIRANRPQGKA